MKNKLFQAQLQRYTLHGILFPCADNKKQYLSSHFVQTDIATRCVFKLQNLTGLSEDAMIDKTYHFLSPEVKFGSKNPDVLAEDFQFIFPVVGPLGKAEFCKVFGSFNVDKALPLDDNCDEASSNYFGFTIDPTEPNRVWFFARSKFIHKGNEPTSIYISTEKIDL